MRIATNGDITTLLHFHPDQVFFADVGDRVVTQHQHHKGHAQGIDVVGQAAQAAPARLGHGAVDGLKHWRLVEAGRNRRAIAQPHHLLGFVHEENVIRSDLPVRDIEGMDVLQAVDQGGHDAAGKIVLCELEGAGLDGVHNTAPQRPLVNDDHRTLPQKRAVNGVPFDQGHEPIERFVLERAHGVGAGRQAGRADEPEQLPSQIPAVFDRVGLGRRGVHVGQRHVEVDQIAVAKQHRPHGRRWGLCFGGCFRFWSQRRVRKRQFLPDFGFIWRFCHDVDSRPI